MQTTPAKLPAEAVLIEGFGFWARYCNPGRVLLLAKEMDRFDRDFYDGDLLYYVVVNGTVHFTDDAAEAEAFFRTEEARLTARYAHRNAEDPQHPGGFPGVWKTPLAA